MVLTCPIDVNPPQVAYECQVAYSAAYECQPLRLSVAKFTDLQIYECQPLRLSVAKFTTLCSELFSKIFSNSRN